MRRARRDPGALAPRRRPLAGLVLAAAAASATAQAAAPAQESAALEAEVRRLVGGATCTADEQCRTLAFGAKACGGPQAYIAWSTLVTDAAVLESVAERYAALRREELRSSGVVSDCAIVVDPGATCAPVGAGGATGPRSCRLRDAAGRARSAR
jgi:hypothetical protein